MLRALAFGRRSAAPLLVAPSRLFHASPAVCDASKPFDKILIANRGEIACRIMRTCKRLGIKTVAVYSDADADSKHVKTADEAIHIGPAASRDSYLKVENILKAVRVTGAQAVHPGYGFLSENSHFVQALDESGVTFIGPTTASMAAMGDKIESKKLAKAAGVHIIPGFIGEVHTDEEVLRIANEIGYPVMIKASAGGGGKGMRIAWNNQEALENFRISKQEAQASFGDDRMLIEKFVHKPRHIEIQVLADKYGNSVYLNERECSIQRRNQKVVEEAPSPFLDPALRKAMGEQAVALAKAVNYHTAGTVEMLVDGDRNFYFLEMNTRLQVEHPITEYITNVDIVEQMIRISAGEKLQYTQADIPIDGWAVEARVYAEDPFRNFLPSIGRLNIYKEPLIEGNPNIRCDSGVEQGSQISITYDPIISKLVCKGKTRDEAMDRMASALDNYVIRGVEHNVPFLRDVMTNKRFRSGDFTTGFIPEEYPKGFSGHQLTAQEHKQLIAVAGLIQWNAEQRANTINDRLPSAPNGSAAEYVISANGKTHNVVVTDENTVTIDGKAVKTALDWEKAHENLGLLFSGSAAGSPVTIQLISSNYNTLRLQHIGTVYPVKVESPLESQLSKHMPIPKVRDFGDSLISPMPGKVISVAVKPGDKVALGQQLAVVEAMKMQNILRAQKDAVVKKVHVVPGADVAVDQVLIEFEQLKAEPSV